MSIENEINRISTNVSDTLAAIEEMGGEVPEGATSNDMASAARTIPVGAKIDDSAPATDKTYSSSKIDALLNEQKEAIDDKLDASELPTAINTALAQAKESGQFDGAPGKDGKDGADGAPGAKGDPGDDYVLTEADKNEIAEMAAELVEVPEGGGGGGETLVAEETVLASGTVPAGTSKWINTDTGLTVGDLREWKVFGFKTTSTESFGMRLSINRQLVVGQNSNKKMYAILEWMDSARTVLRAMNSGGSENELWDNRHAYPFITSANQEMIDIIKTGSSYRFRMFSNPDEIVQIYNANDVTADVTWEIRGIIKVGA